ncbi:MULTISPECIES: alanine racemase [Thermodesulfovibrio]|uniref:alanine racemase n=1 Tax=Thermodesulfovibrio TaxID=28261 RepID=UPI00260E3D93|nr:alanine racemase [Thermodesulfovibrio sp.]
MSRFLQAEINLKNIIHNYSTVKAYLNQKKAGCKIIAIVKADAYGHGAIEISKVYESLGVDYLGVAFFEEALILREAGINSKIIVLFDREIEGIFKYNLIPVVFDKKQAEALSKEAYRRGVFLPVHVKVETGMGRLGIYESPCETIKKIAMLDNIKVEGVMSHLSKTEDVEWTKEQIEKFNQIRECLKVVGITPIFHIANSQGLLYEEAIFDAIRPGLMLYGYGSSQLKPSMTVKTRLLDIRSLPEATPISYGGTYVTKRKSIIGVIPVGYADGYFRTLSNKAEVIIKGRKVPVLGTICMDLTMIDLTEVENPKINDEVVLLGEMGDTEISASHIAQWAGTIPYEVLTSLGSRARKKYIMEEN